MFWKRKSKNQAAADDADAQPDSAAEETTDEVDEAEDTATTAEDAEGSAEAAAADGDASGAAEEDAAAGADTEDSESADAQDEDAEDDDTEDTEDEAEEEPEPEEPAEAAFASVESSGVFELFDEQFEVTNTTWIVEVDSDGVVVVDPGFDAEAVLKAVGEREIYLVACTNGYSPHITAAVDVAERDDAPIALHRRELRQWRKVHGIERGVDAEVEHGGEFEVGDHYVRVLGIPGTSPGSVAYYFEDLDLVCSGDSLLRGAMGTVGDEHVDYAQQLASIGEVLLELPARTRVLPDRGETTSVAAEAKNFDSWVRDA